MPLTIPSIDMIEIGAGGGSIAHVDDLGLLKVGPRSAGSEPGPACYGRGGTEPTVTDADLRAGPARRRQLPRRRHAARPARRREAAIDRLADAAGRRARRRRPAASTASSPRPWPAAARAHATDRGVDHRGLPLLAFGGAGPVHACAVGELLQSTAVIFPPQASVLSAFGTLVTPVRLDLVRSALGRLDALDWDEVDRAARRDDRRGARRRWPRPAARRDAVRLVVRRRPALLRPAERGQRHASTRDPRARPRRRA